MNDRLLPPHLQLFAVAVLVALLGWVVHLIRRRRLNLRDSLLWLLTTVVALAVAAFPALLAAVARALSITVPSNALFALAFVYVLSNLLSMTIAISGGAARLRRVTQECAVLRAEVDHLRCLVESGATAREKK